MKLLIQNQFNKMLRKMTKSEKDSNRHNMSTKVVKTNKKGKSYMKL